MLSESAPPSMGLPVIKLGLVGAIADTAMPVLNSLLRQPRLQLTEVFDPCFARCREHAHRLDAVPSPNLDGLLRRCQGLVIGDVGWMRLEPMVRAAALARSTLVLQPVLAAFELDELKLLQRQSAETRVLMMPEVSYRWARSTLRLRELIATQAGAIELLQLQCTGAWNSHAELLTYDWCSSVMQSECRSVVADEAHSAVTLKFRRLNRDGQSVQARIHFCPEAAPSPFAIADAQIECRHGRIHLMGEDKIDWEIERRKVSESLVSDRSANDVMFDVFGRRLAGGIVPIPELGDLIKAHHIRRACLQSRTENCEVALDS